MFNGQPVFPTATGVSASGSSFTISNSQGITVDQLAALVAMHALMSNPHYAPHTYDEMAQKAKQIAQSMVLVL